MVDVAGGALPTVGGSTSDASVNMPKELLITVGPRSREFPFPKVSL